MSLEIEDSLSGIGKCPRIDSAMINTDLSKFIDVKVDELARCKDYLVALKHDIKVASTNQALGTLSWTSLILQDISKTKITSKVRGKAWYSLNVFGFEIAQSPSLSCRGDIA